MEIAEQVFIVTGGASGLGEGTARRLRQRGAHVLIADLQTDQGQALAHAIGATFVRCDVTDSTQASAAIAQAQRLGSLRGLINCAGIAPAAKTVGRDGPHSLELFAQVLQVNLIGTFNMLRLAAAAMAQHPPTASGERGVLISTASVAAFEGQIGQAAYAASKAGIAGMTLPIARDLAALGIRHMAIAPGIFSTPMLRGMPQSVQDALAASVPFPPRLGQPDDYAKLVEHIIDNEMLNGEVIRLDGAIRMPPK